MIVRIPVPKTTVSASHEPLGPGQTTELRLHDKTYIWRIKKTEGGSELLLILKVCDEWGREGGGGRVGGGVGGKEGGREVGACWEEGREGGGSVLGWGGGRVKVIIVPPSPEVAPVIL